MFLRENDEKDVCVNARAQACAQVAEHTPLGQGHLLSNDGLRIPHAVLHPEALRGQAQTATSSDQLEHSFTNTQICTRANVPGKIRNRHCSCGRDGRV